MYEKITTTMAQTDFSKEKLYSAFDSPGLVVIFSKFFSSYRYSPPDSYQLD